MSWIVREAWGTDLDRLTELVEACFGRSWTRAALEALVTSELGRVRLAFGRAESAAGDPTGDGEAVGFVVARRILDTVEIDLVGVDPAHRRAGVARAMLVDLIEDEIGRDARQLQLELRESNASARALYAALDFVVVGRRSRYYPDGENALLLTRVLSA